MAKIPLMIQDKLASQVTNQVNAGDTGNILAGSAADTVSTLVGGQLNAAQEQQQYAQKQNQAAQQFAAQGNESFQDVATRMRQVQAAKAVAGKALQQKQDDVLIANNIQPIRNQIDKDFYATQESASQGGMKLQDASANFNAQALATLKNSIDSSNMSDAQKAGVQESIINHIGGRTSEMDHFAINEATVQAKLGADVKDAGYVQDAGQNGVKGLPDILQSIFTPENLKANQAIYHLGAYTHMENIAKSAVDAAFTTQVSNDPFALKNPGNGAYLGENNTWGQYLTPKEQMTLNEKADERIRTKTADIEKSLVVQDHGDELTVINQVNQLKTDPSSHTYAADLQTGRDSITGTLNAEMVKPIYKQRPDGTWPLRVDMFTGQPIDYQRPAYIKVLGQKRNEIDGLIIQKQNQDNTMYANSRANKTFQNEQEKKQAAQVANEQKIKLEAVLNEQKIKYDSPNSATARNEFKTALDAFNQFSLGKTSTTETINAKGTKESTSTNVPTVDEISAYSNLARAFQKAESQGAIDMPGTGTSQSEAALKMLLTANNRLKGAVAPDGSLKVGSATPKEQSLTLINSAAPPVLHRLLNDYAGHSTDEVNRDFTYRMVGAYEQFKAKHADTDAEPSPGLVNQWREITSREQLKAAAVKQESRDNKPAPLPPHKAGQVTTANLHIPPAPSNQDMLGPPATDNTPEQMAKIKAAGESASKKPMPGKKEFVPPPPPTTPNTPPKFNGGG
jgi:hypothetical protein